MMFNFFGKRKQLHMEKETYNLYYSVLKNCTEKYKPVNFYKEYLQKEISTTDIDTSIIINVANDLLLYHPKGYIPSKR